MGGSHHNRWYWIGQHVSTILSFLSASSFFMFEYVWLVDMLVCYDFVLLYLFIVTCECDCLLLLFVSEWAINIDNIKVSWLQLRNSFTLDGWVEAWVINAFCGMLFRKKHPRFSSKHFFFDTVSISIFVTAFYSKCYSLVFFSSHAKYMMFYW
jgi:hypothetical protein